MLLLLPTLSAAAVYGPILERVKPGTITIIGENHKRVESVELFQSLALDVVRHHQCVVIGLEIASDQQAILNAVMQDRAPAGAIALWPAIDYPPYRRMIEAFAELKRQGQCIKVIAIDSGTDNVVDRDLWMALSLAEQPENAPILALLGALHTLKRVDWKNAYGRPSVAEILTSKGFSVNSYPQRWFPDKCAGNRIGSFVSDESPQALAMLNSSLMSLINAKRHRSVSGVVDGFVAWECDNLSRDDLPHSSR
jgi:hypothetical protein